ncbi:fructose-1-phosphate kinase, partial [human gut metagenome]
NGVGAGDSMVAGFVAGWIEKQITNMLSIWVLHQEVQALFQKNLATKEEIINVYNQVMGK